MGLAWNAEKGPGDRMGPPDMSVYEAAEAEYIRNAIGEAQMALNDADVAAGAEYIDKAKQHIQRAMDSLAQLVED